MSPVLVSEQMTTVTKLFVKDAEGLSKSTDGLERRFIMLVLSPVVLEDFVFPYQYLQALFHDMASPSSAVTLAALNKLDVVEK